MSDSAIILSQIRQFIKDYIQWSQERGKMYGTVEMLESNWVLLDHIHFILHDLLDQEEQNNFRGFLISKGFGAKNATMIAMEQNNEDPYLVLNRLWNEYTVWRDNRISLIKI